jgi:hypothetical protein
VPLKRIRYHNTRTGPEEVKEDPMMTTKVQEQQWQARAKAQKKNGMSNFFKYPTVLWVAIRNDQEKSPRMTNRR